MQIAETHGICLFCGTTHYQQQDHALITENRLSEWAALLSGDLKMTESGSYLELTIIKSHLKAAVLVTLGRDPGFTPCA